MTTSSGTNRTAYQTRIEAAVELQFVLLATQLFVARVAPILKEASPAALDQYEADVWNFSRTISGEISAIRSDAADLLRSHAGSDPFYEELVATVAPASTASEVAAQLKIYLEVETPLAEALTPHGVPIALHTLRGQAFREISFRASVERSPGLNGAIAKALDKLHETSVSGPQAPFAPVFSPSSVGSPASSARAGVDRMQNLMIQRAVFEATRQVATALLQRTLVHAARWELVEALPVRASDEAEGLLVRGEVESPLYDRARVLGLAPEESAELAVKAYSLQMGRDVLAAQDVLNSVVEFEVLKQWQRDIQDEYYVGIGLSTRQLVRSATEEALSFSGVDSGDYGRSTSNDTPSGP